LRFGRWLALLLGIVGLALLYVAARQHTPEFVQIADIQPGMNFAQVQLRGTVQGTPTIYRISNRVDYVSFPLNDNSGTLTVFASGPLAARLAEHSGLPMRGARVQVRGALTLSRRGAMKLRLQSESQLQNDESITIP
jgi:DNA/RNA endonuclease YhcR with UshA esterase domain